MRTSSPNTMTGKHLQTSDPTRSTVADAGGYAELDRDTHPTDAPRQVSEINPSHQDFVVRVSA